MTTIIEPGNVTSQPREEPDALAVGEELPERRSSGGWTPKPRNESAASTRIAAAISERRVTMIGPMQFGRMWRNMMRRSTRPCGVRRLDELLLPQREERAADDTCEVHPEQERKDEPDPERLALTEVCGGTSRTTRNGNNEEQVDEAHQEVVDLSAVVAGDRPHDRAQKGRDHGDEERHPERRAKPEDDAAQVVAPELVGPEQVPAAQRRALRMTLKSNSS